MTVTAQRYQEDYEYCVVQYFADGSHEYVRDWVGLYEASAAAIAYVHSEAAKAGIVRRVLIVDDGTNIVFEWMYGQGITWPRDAQRLIAAASKAPLMEHGHEAKG
jgi:hypothetical protein